MKIYSDEDFSIPYIKGLVYGTTGNGKTRLVYSASEVPNMCPILGINLGGNPLSIRDYDQEKITIIEPQRVEELDRILNWVADGQKTNEWSRKFCQKVPYKTIVLDGITDTQTMIIDHLSGNTTSLVNQQAITGYKQWGQLLSATTTLARELMRLDLNILVTALETFDTKRDQFLPFLAGQGAERIAHIPYLVGRITNIARSPDLVRQAVKDQKVDRVLQIGASSQVPYAKWQYGNAPIFKINPTMYELIQML